MNYLLYFNQDFIFTGEIHKFILLLLFCVIRETCVFTYRKILFCCGDVSPQQKLVDIKIDTKIKYTIIDINECFLKK